ncbi:MAG: hypothetical protein RIT27_367 [Pseudomonadota bacterium]|jgi:general secretion pathway protein J
MKSRGFTLLEILIAIAIFSIMATFAYSTLQQVITINQQLQQQADELGQLQFLFGRFLEDVSQVVPRPIRDEFGATQPALLGTEQTLALTRSGWENPLELKRSNLQRVEWFLEHKTLYRQYWTVLDRARQSLPIKTPLLKNVESLSLRYLDSQNQWIKQYPPSQPTQNTIKAVEITISLKNWGTLQRLIETPQTAIPPKIDKPSAQNIVQ